MMALYYTTIHILFMFLIGCCDLSLNVVVTDPTFFLLLEHAPYQV